MSDGPPARFRLSLLGNFALTGPDGPVDLPSKKLAGLLAYLALNGPVSRREKLVTLLWGSHFEAQARQNLRQALFRLRRALGQEVVVGDGDDISLAPGVVDCDAARFEALIRDGSRASLAAAVDLYKEQLLADVAIPEEAWADWVSGERQRLEGLALDALVRFAETELSLGHTDVALATVQRALGINELREDAHRVIIQALAATGRKAEALKHYQDLVALLKRELDTEPDAATKSLVAELRREQPPGRSPAVKEAPAPALAQSGQRDGGLPVLKVLIVDDHALIREALHTVLKQLKRETVVFEAANSAQAMRIVGEQPDLGLVLLDINLPDQDGFSVLGELRKRDAGIAIVMLSASDEENKVRRALKLGALGFIPKTTERQVMLNAIELVLAGGIYIPTQILGG
jgi:DNA-binding SARP family transcriptional activator